MRPTMAPALSYIYGRLVCLPLKVIVLALLI